MRACDRGISNYGNWCKITADNVIIWGFGKNEIRGVFRYIIWRYIIWRFIRRMVLIMIMAVRVRIRFVDNIITRCPTKALALKDDDSIEVDNRNCVRCMHCLNVVPTAFSPGDDKGVSILIGGKRTLKIGDLFGTVIVPFMKLETDEDFERITEIAEETIDFFAENALEHERTGEMIERIGLVNFLEGIGVEVDPAMIDHPRESSYVRMDEWDAEAAKWFERKEQDKDAAAGGA